MKISKIMAVAAATAVAASSVALTAFAAPETVTEKKDVVIANSEFAGKETITITVESETEEANYSNGCVGYNNAAGEWTAVEWTLEEATRFEVALDVDADIEAGADLQVQCWWFDKNYTVSWVVTEPETTAPETEAPAVTSETENQPGDCAGKPNQTDAPATDAPATDAPATDAPATDAPVVEYGPEAALDLANKGVSGVDSDGKARLDIINTFVPDEASNILTADALTSAKVNKLTFTFTVSDYTGTAFKAFPIFSFNNWSQAYWGPGDKSNTVDVTPVDVTGNGTYTVELVLPKGVTVEDCQCLALKTDYKVDDTEGAVNPVLSLDSLVANKAADADAPATDAPATDAPTTDAPATEVPGDSNGANAPTGVGLVVVPAVVAGAVLVATGVVLKKRK